MQDEVRSLPKGEREKILQETLPIVIPADHGLAMKANLQLPWNKMRAIRRYNTMYA